MKVAIAGYGVEGQSNYDYYATRGDEVTIVDENETPKQPLPTGAPTRLGAGVFRDLKGFDLVVRTAGLSPSHIETDGKVWSATNEFFAQCPAPIIGVTGTKGKGTTCSLIASILREAGNTVHLVGNIGVPALSVLESIKSEDVVVYELSSFQLWDLEKSPHIAVVLMIEADHLDVHKDMSEYVMAKGNIAAHQTADDIVIYHPTNTYSAQIAALSTGRKARYGVSDEGQAYVESNTFFVQKKPLCDTSALKIAGAFNQENACAAISAALQVASVEDYIEQGLAAFEGLPHRLKFVAEVHGVSYYDNSIATTPGSAIAALGAFEQPKVIILGGSDKGVPYDEVVRACKEANATVLAIGQTGECIYELCLNAGIPVRRVKGLMPAVVKAASELATPGSVVILSPASASFDQYASYDDRGNKFIAAVEEL